MEITTKKYPEQPDIDAITRKYVMDGQEGAMLRHPRVWYSWKRDDNLLKHKLFTEHDFEVIGYYEGEGEFEGTLGGIRVKGNYDKKPIISEVGSGFKVLEEHPYNRTSLWEIRDELIGKKVELKFQGITDKPNDEGFWSLRFPVFNKFKEDR